MLLSKFGFTGLDWFALFQIRALFCIRRALTGSYLSGAAGGENLNQRNVCDSLLST